MKVVTDIPSAPARPIDGHKGTFGTVVVVGGSWGMIGAPALVARAAFRVGAGLVKVASSDDSVLHDVLRLEPSATGLHLAEALRQDAVFAVGPGLGEVELEAVLPRVSSSRGVLDADGLNAVARQGAAELAWPSGWVWTPHPGEYRRLAKAMGLTWDPTDDQQRPRAAAALAERVQGVVLLKGHRAVVSDGARVYTNTTGNPALAAAGTGDVLTGAIAGLMAQSMTGFEAACLAVYAHGLAADRWADKLGPRGMLARELADELARVMPDFADKA